MKASINKTAVVSWSGGKDSCFALMAAVGLGIQSRVLVTVLNEEGATSRAHGIPPNVLSAQAAALQLPIHMFASSWNAYEAKFTAALAKLKAEHQLTHAVFGDIDLPDHRTWEEKVCTGIGLEASLPLWGRDRKSLVLEMLQHGLVAIIVSCNEEMGAKYLGRQLDGTLIEELEASGIDPCGERGEFHTLVTHCPLFRYPLSVQMEEARMEGNYWYATPSLVERKPDSLSVL